MTVLYPNLCYNEVCYKGTALYVQVYVKYEQCQLKPCLCHVKGATYCVF